MKTQKYANRFAKSLFPLGGLPLGDGAVGVVPDGVLPVVRGLVLVDHQLPVDFDACGGHAFGEAALLHELLAPSAEDAVEHHDDSAGDLARNLSDEAFIEVCYQTFLGRVSDPGGLAFWLGQMAAGMSRDTVLQGFSTSAEFNGIMAGYGIR